MDYSRFAKMQLLPNGCKLSKVNIKPSNWEDGGKELLTQHWQISYRFYDRGKSKLIIYQDLNKINTLAARRSTVIDYLKEMQVQYFANEGNPIKKTIIVNEDDSSPITTKTSFVEAIEYAQKMIKKDVSINTYNTEVTFAINQILKAAKKLKVDKMAIWDVTLKYVYQVLELSGNIKDGTFSPDKFNRNKKVLTWAYDRLIIMEVAQFNFPMSIKRRKTGAKESTGIFTAEERKKILEYFSYSPAFQRYLKMFYSSGARTTEMILVKVSDVDMESKEITYLDSKGTEYEYKKRPMVDVAIKYWQEAIRGAKMTDFVFGVGFIPGPAPVTKNAIKLRWQRMQKETGIKGGIYKLKHTNATELQDIAEGMAQALTNESAEMIKRHYDTNAKGRADDKVRRLAKEL